MVRLLKEKPQAFENIPYWMQYYEGYDKAGPYCYCGLDFMYGPESGMTVCFLHLEVVRFNHNLLKTIKADWQFIKEIVKNFDCSTIILIKEGKKQNQQSYLKFIDHFGFYDNKTCTVSTQEI
jgi:hypothetical protein